MKQNYSNEHSEHTDFFNKVEIKFEESKDEIWKHLSDKISSQPQVNPKIKPISTFWFKIAASFIFLIVTSLFMRFYSSTVQSERGFHLTQILPDGSKVNLNASSIIKIYPIWWYFEKEVILEGEAFFKVPKGENFTVISQNGKTEVLGTSFNIYARGDEYKVFCETGKVRVSNKNADLELIINPGEMAILDNFSSNGKIQNFRAKEILGWKENKFNFTSEKLTKVFAELERQYGVFISIELENPTELVYTGYFTKTSSVNQTLDLICKSYDFTFVELGNNHYKVLQKNLQ